MKSWFIMACLIGVMLARVQATEAPEVLSELDTRLEAWDQLYKQTPPSSREKRDIYSACDLILATTGIDLQNPEADKKKHPFAQALAHLKSQKKKATQLGGQMTTEQIMRRLYALAKRACFERCEAKVSNDTPQSAWHFLNQLVTKPFALYLTPQQRDDLQLDMIWFLWANNHYASSSPEQIPLKPNHFEFSRPHFEAMREADSSKGLGRIYLFDGPDAIQNLDTIFLADFSEQFDSQTKFFEGVRNATLNPLLLPAEEPDYKEREAKALEKMPYYIARRVFMAGGRYDALEADANFQMLGIGDKLLARKEMEFRIDPLFIQELWIRPLVSPRAADGIAAAPSAGKDEVSAQETPKKPSPKKRSKAKPQPASALPDEATA